MSKNVFAIDKKTHQRRTILVREGCEAKTVFLASSAKKLLVSRLA